VNEVAHELGCDWHTVNDAVVAYGAALVEDPGRFGDVTALGLDEVLFVRRGARHTQEFTTQLVDVKTSQLLDIVEGRGADEPKRWILARGATWRSKVQFGTLDLSSTYRSAFASVLAHATLIADPFHLVRLANAKVDERRRRVQNEVLGHRGRKSDPLYRCRRLLIKAAERLDERGQEKMLGLLRVGDPRGDVTAAWHAKEAVRELYSHADAQLATEWIEQLIVDMADPTWPVEVRSLGRTLAKWKHEIIAWHVAHFTNGPTEAMNNLIKRVKRVAFGFTSFRNYRIRSLLYAGKPNWDLLATVTPR
jgi:transposase